MSEIDKGSHSSQVAQPVERHVMGEPYLDRLQSVGSLFTYVAVVDAGSKPAWGKRVVAMHASASARSSVEDFGLTVLRQLWKV